MKNVVLPDDMQRSLSFYLAMEEYVADRFDEEIFFVWQSPPTVIIGRNQELAAEVNVSYCREHGVEVVRRRSGGGCVYSDMGNIMISYVSRKGDSAMVFDRYLSALTECLRSIGLDAVRSERNDVLVSGMKVSGSAMQQLPGRTIAHGTLLFSTDLDALEYAIRPPVEKLQRHGIASVRQRVANLSRFLPAHWNICLMKRHLISFFTDSDIILSDGDVAEIVHLKDESENKFRPDVL